MSRPLTNKQEGFLYVIGGIIGIGLAILLVAAMPGTASVASFLAVFSLLATAVGYGTIRQTPVTFWKILLLVAFPIGALISALTAYLYPPNNPGARLGLTNGSILMAIFWILLLNRAWRSQRRGTQVLATERRTSVWVILASIVVVGALAIYEPRGGWPSPWLLWVSIVAVGSGLVIGQFSASRMLAERWALASLTTLILALAAAIGYWWGVVTLLVFSISGLVVVVLALVYSISQRGKTGVRRAE